MRNYGRERLSWSRSQPISKVVRKLGLTAGDGPAGDVISTDIDVRETGTSPVGHSLQLAGQGVRAADFHWTGPTTATRGSINADQVFEPGN